jgi:hypothetical protein
MQLAPIRQSMAMDLAATMLVRRDLIAPGTLTDPDTEDGAPVQVVRSQVEAAEERTEQIGRRSPTLIGEAATLWASLTGQNTFSSSWPASNNRGLCPHVFEGNPPSKTAWLNRGARHLVRFDPATRYRHYLGEGLDLLVLDALFRAFPISGWTRVVQYVGRVARALPAGPPSRSTTTSTHRDQTVRSPRRPSHDNILIPYSDACTHAD